MPKFVLRMKVKQHITAVFSNRILTSLSKEEFLILPILSLSRAEKRLCGHC